MVTKALVAGIVFLATFAIPVSSLILSSSNNAYATGNSNSSNTVSATLPGSVAIRLLNAEGTTKISSLDFNLTPTASGTSATQSMVVDVATSNPTGYKLYMHSNYQDSGSNYTTNLVHTTNGTPDADISDVIPTYVPGSGSGSGTNTLYWNYINPLLNANVADPSSKVASTIPAYGNPDKLDQYFTTTNSRQTEVSFNVSVDTTIVSGTYENQLLFSAVGNPTTLNYSISFDTDGGTMVGEDITESAAAGTHSITIPTTSDYTPTKQGYNFTHWQIVIPQGSGVTASCNNTNICNPGDNIIIHSAIDSQGDFEGAVGLKANYEASGITSISYMQQMTSDLCTNSAEGDTVTLTDTRDNNTYTVRKLKDGNCWMTQNLNLQGPVTLTPADSNVSSNWILPTTTTAAWTSGSTVTVDPNGGSATTLTDKWCNLDESQQCEDQIVNMYSGVENYGSYYTWRAATAGTGDYSLISGNATSSICPKGWRLPTGGDNGEFQALYNEYPSSEDMRNNNGPNFVLSGNRSGSRTDGQGSTSGYWSSTGSSSVRAYGLLFSLSVYPTYGALTYNGFTLRCLASSTIHGLTVDPNGGTWEGSTEKRTFTGDSGSTKEISSPTKTSSSYTISYDDNSQGATFTSYPTSTTETFTGWQLNGSGSFDNSTYTFGDGSATLTAQYSNSLRSFTLPNIVKPDYTCKWAEGSPSDTQYPGGTFRTISGNTTYYAVCTTANITTISTMQEMTTSVCSNSNLGDSNTLRDIRDNNTYTVRKLADNNCWMTQNLRLVGRDAPFTQDDTQAPPAGFTMTKAAENTGTWCTEDSSACDDQVQYLNSGNTSYGVYYNWYTATAGSGIYSMSSGNASYSICPKGWRLPTGGSSGEFQALYSLSEYNSFDKMVSSLGPHFVLAGRRGDNTVYYQDDFGDNWSSTIYNNRDSYELTLIKTSSTVIPTNHNPKFGGFSVRCLAQNPTYTLTINPNGGKLNGSTDVQSYTGTTGETKTVSNPTGPAYNITYDDNNQGATFTTTPATANRVFSSWSLSGSGSFAGGTYEYASGNGMLTAQYDTESNMFILPFISKSGYSCRWAEGSPSGTLHTGGSGYTTVSSDTTFYAVCTNNTFNSISNMQDMTPTICANASTGDAATLTDTRDNKTYTIRKLADGNCWMTQNLALTGRDAPFTQADSDVSSSGFSMPTSAEDTGTWCTTDDSACNDQAKYLDSGNGSYGVYYNWYTATAGSGTYNTSSGNVGYSICPKGWRLPIEGEFAKLDISWGGTGSSRTNANTYGNFTEAIADANHAGFVLAGRRVGDSIESPAGGIGSYWSSTIRNNSSAYNLYLRKNDKGVWVPDYGNKNVGFSMRCIAKGYDVNISNSNTTSSTDKLDIPYGGSKTVTVTPSSGYYLSNVTCPSGYTCSGYGTGTSYTGQQTVTVQNNSTTSGGTLAFTGTLAGPTSCATATPVTPGQAPGTNNMYTSGGVQYVKLKTGASTSACYTKASRGTATWANASSLCPSGTGVPTQAEFSALISSSAYNTGANLYTATGWSGRYWSSTSLNSSLAYHLVVGSSGAPLVYFDTKTNSNNVVCVVR